MKDCSNRNKYRLTFQFFWLFSGGLFGVFIALSVIFYLTKFRSVMTLSHLFFLLFLLLMTMMSLVLGCYFHQLSLIYEKQNLKQRQKVPQAREKVSNKQNRYYTSEKYRKRSESA